MNGKDRTAAPARKPPATQRPAPGPTRTGPTPGNQATGRALGRSSQPRSLFRLTITGPLTAEELREEFLRQYYGASTEPELASKRPLWSIPNRGTLPAEVERGFAWVSINVGLQTDLNELSKAERSAVNEETDRRYHARSGLPPGTKIKKGDAEGAALWLGIRNAVLAEDKQLKQLHALPDDIKAILFAGGKDAPELTPQDFTRALEIAARLAELSPDERKDYKARVTRGSTSLEALDASITQYLSLRTARAAQEEKKEDAARAVFGQENLFRLYRNLESLRRTASMQSSLSGMDREGLAPEAKDFISERLAETEREFTAELKRQGYSSEAEFVAAIGAYRTAFQTRAATLVQDVLARYENRLYREETELAQGRAMSIAQRVAASQARAHYREQDESEAQADIVQLGIDPMEKGPNKARMHSMAAKARADAAAAGRAGDAEVDKSLGELFAGEKGINRRKVAALDAEGIRQHLSSVIADRRKDIAEARAAFTSNPERVFKIPELIAATKQLEGVEPGTIYNDIVDDYVDEIRSKSRLKDIGLAILAIALAVLVPGGGWIGAAALVAGTSLSVYQAVSAYNEYVEDTRDYNLGFIQKEPSLIWVTIAVAGAALDLGVAVSAVWKASSPALKALEVPLTDFAKTGDKAGLLAKIEAAEGLDKAVKRALAKELEFAAAETEAVEAFAKGNARAASLGALDPALAKSSFRSLYYGIRRGVTTWARLRADKKLMTLMAEVTGQAGLPRKELEAAFDEVLKLVKVGEARKMDPDTLLSFVDRWAINRSIPGHGERLLDEMKFWRPLTAEQRMAMNTFEQSKAAVAELRTEKASLLQERETLVAQQRVARTEETRLRLLEINQRLGQLDPSLLQATTKKRVTVFRNGELTEEFVDVPVRHPPGEIARAEASLAKAEQGLAASQVTLYDRLRAAAPSLKARESALKGVSQDQVGTLLTRPTNKLEVDHIVPVKEITDMDGFSRLTWAQQKEIVDNSRNLVVMDSAANASKGSRSWQTWKQSSNFYDPDTIARMAAAEAQVRAHIRNLIDEALKRVR